MIFLFFSLGAITLFQEVFAGPDNLFIFVGNETANSFGGPQVVKVVVIDSDINDTDEVKGEPAVSVNGKIIRMVQAVDGDWYGYFSDRDNALLADSAVVIEGTGLDFGVFCSSSAESVIGVTVVDTVGIAIQDPELVSNEVNGNPDGTPITNDCNFLSSSATPNDLMNVLNDEIAMNPAHEPVAAGQIGLTEGFWPFIQLYNIVLQGNATVQYNKGGGNQTITLDYANIPDFDGDGVNDGADNCPITVNSNQLDIDVDGIGDLCDTFNEIATDTIITSDFTSLGTLIVQESSLLTINSGVTLIIPSGSNITIQFGSGVLIKNGGSLQINL